MDKDNSESILRGILAVVARQAIPPEVLNDIVSGRGGSGGKQVKAYNMCNGENTQAEIVKALKLDSGNFSRTVSRWEDAGIVVRLNEGKLLHVYPLAGEINKKKASK